MSLRSSSLVTTTKRQCWMLNEVGESKRGFEELFDLGVAHAVFGIKALDGAAGLDGCECVHRLKRGEVERSADP